MWWQPDAGTHADVIASEIFHEPGRVEPFAVVAFGASNALTDGVRTQPNTTRVNEPQGNQPWGFLLVPS
jgi:hypothetical protein